VRPLTYEQAVDFFSALYGGKHHIPGARYGDAKNVKVWGTGWSVSHYGDLSTYDFDMLTRLVLLAHDRCVRACIRQGGPGGVKVCISARDREGGFSERHPTIEEALARFRELNGEMP